MRCAPCPLSSIRRDRPLPHRLAAADVVLLWPYSSLSRALTLVLAQPPFHVDRLAVRCAGASAAALARCRVGIGDSVALSAEGGVWSAAGRPGGAGPGGAEWTLSFGAVLRCQVRLLSCLPNTAKDDYGTTTTRHDCNSNYSHSHTAL